MSKNSKKQDFILKMQSLIEEYSEVVDKKTHQSMQVVINSYAATEENASIYINSNKDIPAIDNYDEMDVDEKHPSSSFASLEDELQFIIPGATSSTEHLARYVTPDEELEKILIHSTFGSSKSAASEDQDDEKQPFPILRQNSYFYPFGNQERLYNYDGSIIAPGVEMDSFGVNGWEQLTTEFVSTQNNFLISILDLESIDSHSTSEEFLSLFDKYIKSTDLNLLKQNIIRSHNVNSCNSTTLYSLIVKDGLVNGKYVPTSFFMDFTEYYASAQSSIDASSYSEYSESLHDHPSSELQGTDRRYKYKLLFSNEEILSKIGELGIIIKDNQLYCKVINKADLQLIKVNEKNSKLGISKNLYNKLLEALNNIEKLQIVLSPEEKNQLYNFASANLYYLDRTHLQRNSKQYKELANNTFESYKKNLKKVSVWLSDDETCLEFGSSRPPVRHAGRYQMRHLSPYGVMKEVFAKKYSKIYNHFNSINSNEKDQSKEQDHNEYLLKSFLYEIEDLINFDEIRVILFEEEFLELIPYAVSRYKTHKIVDNKKVEKIDDCVFLIKSEWDKLVSNNPNKKNEIDLIIQAQPKRKDDINSLYKNMFLDCLLSIMFDDKYNYVQKLEKISAISLVVYNTLPFVSFPKEVHTMNTEIRYYPLEQNSKKSEYYILSDINQLTSIKHGRIYAIKNEGANITKIINIFNYYDKKLQLIVTTITNEIKAYCASKIAILSWECFDFKPLEKTVLVKVKPGKNNIIPIYTSVDAKKVSYYKLADGKKSRKINKKKADQKYTQSINWRSEEYEEDLLIMLSARHLNIIFIMNEGFNIIAEEIIDAYALIVANEYKKSGYDADVNNIQIRLKDLLSLHWKKDEIETTSSKYLSNLSSSASELSRSSTPVHIVVATKKDDIDQVPILPLEPKRKASDLPPNLPSSKCNNVKDRHKNNYLD